MTAGVKLTVVRFFEWFVPLAARSDPKLVRRFRGIAAALPVSILGAEAAPEMHAMALISSATLMQFAAAVIAGECARARARLREALERAQVANRVKSTF